jgi:hypothetical protein
MIKSRVDWLLEFADTALTEAIEAAARTGSVLHLYLVGFENFDAEHLELFNKGYDVEANVRAIETLRRLGERFPDAFEYRRYRAHGIVLFTPWTSPESLLENARWMRKVRFDEVRAEAVRTRLRLYPRLPLYALAEREGLLLTEWPPGRTDRAFEQGYDASTPWRFRDPRTEAIYQAANALHEHAPELTDADVLEATVRFVLRWPALGAAPRRAPRALILATAAWNVALDRAAREFGAAALALNPWLAALAAGAIEVVARTDLDEATVAEAAAALAAMGFVVAQVPGSQAAARLARPIRPEATVLLVTRSAERLHGAVDPECCVAAYRAGSHPARGLDDERAMLLRSPAEPLDPMLNRLGAIALTTHQPCSPSCAASRALAERLLATFDPETRNGVMAALRRSVLALDDGRRAELEGIWRGDAFEVRASRPFRPHDAAFAADLKRVQLETSGVVAERSNGVVERIDAPRPLLITPGETMTAEALRAIRAHLPPAFRQKTRVAGYEITSVDAQGAEYAVVLGRSERRISLRIRPYDPSRPATVRRGAWAVDVPDVAALDAPAREAIRVLIAALPA